MGEKSESMAKRLQVQADAEGGFAKTISSKEVDVKFIARLVQELAGAEVRNLAGGRAASWRCWSATRSARPGSPKCS